MVTFEWTGVGPVPNLSSTTTSSSPRGGELERGATTLTSLSSLEEREKFRL